MVIDISGQNFQCDDGCSIDSALYCVPLNVFFDDLCFVCMRTNNTNWQVRKKAHDATKIWL